MEAALWDRHENVEHILEHGAKKGLKENHSFKAIDLATPSDRNKEERYWRPGGEDQVYKEYTYIANQARRVDVSMLKDDISDHSPAAADEKVGINSSTSLQAGYNSLLQLPSTIFQVLRSLTHVSKVEADILP